MRIFELAFAHRLSLLGSRVFLAACLMLGLIQLGLYELLPPLQQLEPAPPALIAISAAMLVIPSARQLASPAGKAAPLIVALYWAAATAIGLAAMGTLGNLLSWVPIWETGLFTLVSLGLAFPPSDRAGKLIADGTRYGGASALIFFGYVHLSNPAAITGLIPEWIAGANYWPYVTGCFLVAAGIGMTNRRLAMASAVTVAAMFCSWLVLIHVERLMLDPGSMFEWNFALTALALAGAMLAAARPVDRT